MLRVWHFAMLSEPLLSAKPLLLKRFPSWRKSTGTYRYLEPEFYVERANAYSVYNSANWLETLPLSATLFSLKFVMAFTLFSAALLPFREVLSDTVPKLMGVNSVMGGAVSFLMVFRINNGYSRWALGRAKFEIVVGLCDTAAVAATAAIPRVEHKKQFLTELLAFPVTLKNLLRGVKTGREELVPVERGGLMSDEQLELLNEATSSPFAVLEALHHTLREGVDQTGPYQGSAYVHLLNLLQGLAQGRRRLRNVPGEGAA